MNMHSPSAEMFRMLRAAGCDTENAYDLQMGMIAYNTALLAWDRRNTQKITIVRPADKSRTGRNDPCPCGSGKKYKKCCLDKNREFATESRPRAAWAFGPDCLPHMWDEQAIADDCAILGEIMDRDPAFAEMRFSNEKVASFMDAIVKEDPTFLHDEKADLERKIDDLAAHYVRESGEGEVSKTMSKNILDAIPCAQSKDEMRALAAGLCFTFMEDAPLGADASRAPEASLLNVILFRRALFSAMRSVAIFGSMMDQLGGDTQEVRRMIVNNDPAMRAKIQSCMENLSPSEIEVLQGSFERTRQELWDTISSGKFPVPIPIATQLAFFLKLMAETGSAKPSIDMFSASITAFCDELIEEDYVLYSRMLDQWLKDCKSRSSDVARAVQMMQGLCGIRSIEEFVPNLIVNSMGQQLFIPFEVPEQQFIERSLKSDDSPEFLAEYGAWLASKGFPGMADRLLASCRDDARTTSPGSLKPRKSNVG